MKRESLQFPSLYGFIKIAVLFVFSLLPPRSFQHAIRERAAAADSLAAAHSDYARAVTRCQQSVEGGDGVTTGGPPAGVVVWGDRVVAASDTFAEAHGRAEEALSGLLEERGRCLREAVCSVRK